MHLSWIDIAIIVLYGVAIFGLAQWVSRDKTGAGQNHHRLFPRFKGSALVGDRAPR